MKVVINKCHRGLWLSQVALRALKKLGLQEVQGPENRLFLVNGDDCEVRSNPKVVKVVEELGSEALNIHMPCDLKVVDIPFETTEGWGICYDDGREHIYEWHRTWE